MPEKKNRQSTRISANRVPNHSLTSPRQNRRVSCCSRNRSAERWTRASALADTCRIHFFCERRSASQASRRALAISRETDLWEVESEGTRCDWLRFAWIGGLFQIRRNSKKKYCGKEFLLLPCSLREAPHAFQACSRLELLTAFVSQGISKHQLDSVFLVNLRCSRVIIDSNNIGIRVIVL